MEVKKKEVVHRKTKDRWEFLEEIEAPMWVDLTAEGNFSEQVINRDSWFESSHVFHQWSSQRLKSAFSNSRLDWMISSDMDLQGSSSPQLPSSVSRSRGKHYQSRNWNKNQSDTVKVLNGSFSHVDDQSNRLTNKKSSLVNPKKGVSRSKSVASVESENAGRVYSETKSTSGSEYLGGLSSEENKDSRSNTRSTITYEDSQKEDKTEVSSRQVLQASESVRGKKISFRTTCVKKKASGLDISIGSSSNNALQHKSSTVTSSHHMKNIQDCRHASMPTLSFRRRKEPFHQAKTSINQVHLGKSNFRKESMPNLEKSANHECGKPQVKHQTARSRVLQPINKPNLCDVPAKTKGKSGMFMHDSSASLGKENLPGLVHRRFNVRDAPSKDSVPIFKSLQKHGKGVPTALKTKERTSRINSPAGVGLR